MLVYIYSIRRAEPFFSLCRKFFLRKKKKYYFWGKEDKDKIETDGRREEGGVKKKFAKTGARTQGCQSFRGTIYQNV
jgi:hypothetical protein